MRNRVEKDKSPPPIRAESRRSGARRTGGSGEYHLGAGRRTTVSAPARPRYRAELEWPDVLVRQEEWYRRGYCLCLFVETRAFCFLRGVALMNCPKCGKPMESGTMYAGKYPLWTQRKKPPLFRAPKDRVILRPLGDTSVGDFAFPFHNYPDTMLCRACNIACFSFQLP